MPDAQDWPPNTEPQLSTSFVRKTVDKQRTDSISTCCGTDVACRCNHRHDLAQATHFTRSALVLPLSVPLLSGASTLCVSQYRQDFSACIDQTVTGHADKWHASRAPESHIGAPHSRGARRTRQRSPAAVSSHFRAGRHRHTRTARVMNASQALLITLRFQIKAPRLKGPRRSRRGYCFHAAHCP